MNSFDAIIQGTTEFASLHRAIGYWIAGIILAYAFNIAGEMMPRRGARKL